MKPKVFVGSSTESLEIAYALQENLEHDAEVTVWNQGIFDLSRTALDTLVDSLDNFDFGVFVLGPDDEAKIRGKEHQVPRDNVVLELGLLIGKLGKERAFLVVPVGQEDLHLPTDLLGLTPATFSPDREDKNINAALGPACNKIRKSMQKLGLLHKTPPGSEIVVEEYNENDIISLIESWMGSRPESLNRQAIKFSDVDRELNLPQGSAKKYIEIAARNWDYQPKRKGELTIVFESVARSDDSLRSRSRWRIGE